MLWNRYLGTLNKTGARVCMEIDQLTNIEWLIQNGGEVTLGKVGPVWCAGTASDGDLCYAMLVRDDDESLAEFLQRLDAAIQNAMEHETYIDEINPAS
jgi:hypothetical protein